MSSESPPTLESTESDNLLDYLRHNAGTANKNRKAVRNYCMALLMLDAGLRVGEVVSLRIDDLLFNSEPVRSILIKPHMTKNKVEHSIPVSPRLSQAIKQMALSYWPPPPGDCHWFAFYQTVCMKSITTRQIERIICAAGWKVLGRPVHPHVLRHTFASRLMRVTNSSTVQQLLGHKYLSSTQIYCHPNEDDKRQAIESASHPPGPAQSAQRPQQDQSPPDEHQARKPLPASPVKSQPSSRW